MERNFLKVTVTAEIKLKHIGLVNCHIIATFRVIQKKRPPFVKGHYRFQMQKVICFILISKHRLDMNSAYNEFLRWLNIVYLYRTITTVNVIVNRNKKF